MKVTNIQYGKSYELQGYWEKISIDIQVDENELPNTVLDTAKNIVDGWHRERNPYLYDVDKKKETTIYDTKIQEAMDREFDELKTVLSKIPYREDAQLYLETTSWKLAIEAKALVNSKPSKTK